MRFYARFNKDYYVGVNNGLIRRGLLDVLIEVLL